MSNKITGSDLEKLINEAMGLKVEADNNAREKRRKQDSKDNKDAKPEEASEEPKF